jgi:hypothetical protein
MPMNTFALIYRTQGLMPQSVMVDAATRSEIVLPEVSEDAFLEQIVDFDAKTITRVGVLDDGRIIVIPEGDFGVNTPAEYFEEEAEEI